jgi:nitrile hydratase
MTYASHADLGGELGHGRVVPESEDERFHAAWEARTLAVTLATGGTGLWNIDMTRSARETLPDYAALSYYEVWFHGLVKLVIEHGLAAADEIAAGRRLRPAREVPRILRAHEVPGVLARGAPTERGVGFPPRFAVGGRVRTRSDIAPHHTRLPGYLRGKLGVIERVHGAHVFADSNAQGLGEAPQWLYNVVFDERDVWGGDAPEQGFKVSIDAWEPYLQPA